MSKKSGCPSGMIMRVGYTRNVGSKKINVKPNCIPALSQSGLKRTEVDKVIMQKKAKMHEKARKMFRSTTPKVCSKGKILREGYYRKSRKASRSSSKGTWVAPSCVPSINQQKGKQLFVLEPEVLKRFGYEKVAQMSRAGRHVALDKAVKSGLKPLSVLRRLNALYVLNKNSNPELAAKFREDVNYVRSTKEYQARQVSRSRKSSRKSKKSN